MKETLSMDEKPVSQIVGERGIKTSGDFADFFAALMADVVSRRISPDEAKAACLAGASLLQIARLQLEYAGLETNEFSLKGSDRRLVGKTTGRI